MYDGTRGWVRRGPVFPPERGRAWSVVGDPCVVWDDDVPGWRMFLVWDPPGNGQAICRQPADAGPGSWEPLGPLAFVNPTAILGGHAHKPFVVMDPHRPNRAARVRDRFWLLLVTRGAVGKVVQRAWADRLGGPWHVEAEPVLAPGEAWDGRHVDAPTGYFFAERQEFLYFYMGYPSEPQRRSSPLGSVQAVAAQGRDEDRATKLGVILEPDPRPGHWAGGWLGGLQLLPGTRKLWMGLVNASPTPPRAEDTAISREEPPPSLAGWASCDLSRPIGGWTLADAPREWLSDLPSQALAWGEGANLWRQHLLALEGGRWALFYNSGPYGQEDLFLQEWAPTPVAAPASGGA